MEDSRNKTKVHFKTKMVNMWEKAKRKADKARIWCVANPQLAVVGGSIVVVGLKQGGKLANKAATRANLARQQRAIKRRCYDPKYGHYWFLKRELSNQEWLTVEKRHSLGEDFGDIFLSMGVLK